jgi:RsiW-degrading membrane proteinase PrsW (M82 family)
VERRLVIPMIFVVLAVWLLGTWVTKYTLEEMAVFTPIAIAALGAFVAIILLWVKIVRDSFRRRTET